MAKYRVKRYWEVSDFVEVEANSISEAMMAADYLPLSEVSEGEFVRAVDSDENDVEVI